MSGGDLVTADSYGAFDLTLDWKVERGGNSGVFYLARDAPGTRNIYETGIEMQVIDNEGHPDGKIRSEEHTSELQSLMRISYAVFYLKKQQTTTKAQPITQ